MLFSGEEQIGRDVHGNQDFQKAAGQSDEETLVQSVTQVVLALNEQDSLQVLDNGLDELAQGMEELQGLDADQQDLKAALATTKRKIIETHRREMKTDKHVGRLEQQ